MDTLPQDLINLISNKLRTSDCLLLGIETPDNQPYLDLITFKARLKLALEQDNVGWIHQVLKHIEHNILTSGFFGGISINTKYVWIIPYIQNDRRLYDYYVRGLRGLPLKEAGETEPYYEVAFTTGLTEGLHYKLFDLLITSINFIGFECIMNFENEEYIINKIDSLIVDFGWRTMHRLSIIVDKALEHKRFKVVQYLLIKYKECINHPNNNNCRSYLIHTNQFTDQYNDKNLLKSAIYQACIDSNYAALNYIYTNIPRKYKNTTFRAILSSCLITRELHQHAIKNFDPSIKLNQKLIDSADGLRIYMDEYKYFYNHTIFVGRSSYLFDFVVCVLLQHYNNTNNFVKFKTVYNIAMTSQLLVSSNILRSISNFMSIYLNKSIFSLTHDMYYKMNDQELKTIAKQKNMRKSELIATLMKDCC